MRGSMLVSKAPFSDATTKAAAAMAMSVADTDPVAMMMPMAGSALVDSTVPLSINEGMVITEVGPDALYLKSLGLQPISGDVVYSIDGDVVTHLNAHQLKRLLWRKQQQAKAYYASLGIIHT